MSLDGELTTMALPDLLQWLSGASKSGTLRVTNGRFCKEILFRGGHIVSCSSDDPREYLGQFLLSNQMISEDQLRQAMETQRATGVMLGRILLMVNAITEDDLRKMLTRKAEESIFGVFLWNSGSFEFHAGEPDLERLLPLSLKVEDILLEGLRRYDELTVILKAFRSDDFVLRHTEVPVPTELAASTEVTNLLRVVDGKRTLTEICLQLRLSEFKVSRVAYALYRHGCVAIVDDAIREEKAEEVVPVTDIAADADRLLAARKFEEALDLLGGAVAARGHDLALKTKMEEVEAGYIEQAYRHYLPPDQILTTNASMDALTSKNLTPQEMFLLSRINGSWTVKDIVTVAPLREVEALRVLKTLRERGVIDLVSPQGSRTTAV
ncbi:MAG: DUF4388 domain-containing protein [Acidobacteriota bacterium]